MIHGLEVLCLAILKCLAAAAAAAIAAAAAATATAAAAAAPPAASAARGNSIIPASPPTQRNPHPVSSVSVRWRLRAFFAGVVSRSASMALRARFPAAAPPAPSTELPEADIAAARARQSHADGLGKKTTECDV